MDTGKTEDYYCSNCSCPVSYSIDKGTRSEADYIEFIANSCFRKVANVSVIMELYRLTCKSMEFELAFSSNKLPLCCQCSGLLTTLYKLYEEFNSARKVGSIISQLIASADFHDGCTAVEDLTSNTSKDEDENEAQNHHPDHEMVPDSMNMERSSDYLHDKSEQPDFSRESSERGSKDEMESKNEGMKTKIHIPGANALVDGIDYEQRNNHLGVLGREDLEGSGTSSSSAKEYNNGNESHCQVQFPRSTTAIAVPIGENLFQIYRVAPALPKKPPFTCMHCGKVKKSLGLLRNHIHNVHDTHKFVTCPKCPKVFKKPCLLKRHLVIHDEEREGGRKRGRKSKSSLMCSWPDCGRSFQHSASLRRHETRHRPERPFVCPHCHKGFKLLGDLKNHMEFHKDGRPYICDKCGKSYKVASNLNTHIVNVHTEEGRLKYNQYMRMKTREKRLRKMASGTGTGTKEEHKNVEAEILNQHVVHEDFPDFFVASEAEIGTAEITRIPGFPNAGIGCTLDLHFQKCSNHESFSPE